MIGLIGTLSGSSTFTYTSPATCKLLITAGVAGSNNSITLNGISFMNFVAASGTGVAMTDNFVSCQTIYLTAGQQITLGTSTSAYVILSAYEE